MLHHFVKAAEVAYLLTREISARSILASFNFFLDNRGRHFLISPGNLQGGLVSFVDGLPLGIGPAPYGF